MPHEPHRVGSAVLPTFYLGLAVTQASLQSKTVLAAEQAFVGRWPDGLTLSDRLWR